jgi:N6-adenosine-specific RNA methylase IME4
MTVKEIAALPVADLAADDSRCFLWTINYLLPAALDVLARWGFSYRQTLIWHKPNASPYVRSVAVLDLEFLLVGQRGAPGRLTPARSSLISKAIARHSEKPDAFLDLVERVSPGPYAELFARRARLGWEYPIGDQSLGGVAA